MNKNFDIIKFPLQISSADEIFLNKTKDSYEMRIINELNSKKLQATKTNENKKFFLIKVENDECISIKIATKFYEFNSPADFYIPTDKISKQFYDEMYQRMLYDDNESFLEYSKNFDEMFRNKIVPMCPPPYITTSGIFENYNFKNYSFKREEKRGAIQVRFDDPIPKEGNKELKNKLLSLHGEEEIDFIVLKLNEYFDQRPIIKLKSLKEELKNDKEFIEKKISYNKIKSVVPIVGYFCVSGPWINNWIRFGYDPKSDINCYKFQNTSFKTIKGGFSLVERKDLLETVESNKKEYLVEQCDPIRGFHSEKLHNFIKKSLKKKIKLPNAETKNNDEFDVYD